MANQLTRKCRSASATHGHLPGKCPNLATEPEQLCKTCYDRTSEKVKDLDQPTSTAQRARIAFGPQALSRFEAKASALAMARGADGDYCVERPVLHLNGLQARLEDQ